MILHSERLESVVRLANRNLRDVNRFHNSPSRLNPSEARAGQIWCTKVNYLSPSGKRVRQSQQLVLILKGPLHSSNSSLPDIQVAVLSPLTWMASQYDLVLPEHEYFVGRSIVCFWNTGPILLCNLDKYVTTLDRRVLDQCERVWKRADGLDEVLIDETIGTPIHSTADVRVQFQNELRMETEFLWHHIGFR